MRTTMVGLATAFALALTPAAANALTISSSGGTITVQADAGEANRLSVAVSGANWRFTDTGTKLDGTAIVPTAGPGCALAVTNVDCPMAGVTSAVVNTLDRTDQVSFQAFTGVAVTADGGEAGDNLTTANGADTLSGGPGNDQVFAGAGNDTLNGGPGADVLIGENLSGEAGNDTINGDGGEDILLGDAGGTGNDTLNGGDDNDLLLLDAGNDTLNGGAGVDQVASQEDANYTLSLDGVANDTSAVSGTDNVMPDIENVSLNNGDDTVVGSSANNVIQTTGGDDNVQAGDGNDQISAGSGNDTVAGGTGDDVENGGAGADVMGGGPNDDIVDGDDGTDQLSGEDGTDTLVPDLGSDVISGGPGTDTVAYAGIPVSASLDGAANDGPPGENQNIGTDVENINGSTAADVLVGGPGFNVLNGLNGDDAINTRDAAADLVLCGPGFDAVTADGADSIDDSTGPCEATDFGDLTGFGPAVGVVFAKKAGKKAKLTATCPFGTHGFCQGTIDLKAKVLTKTKNKPVGSAAFFLQPGQSQGESIELSKAARKTLDKKNKLKVTATIKASDERGATKSSTQKTTLKPS